MGFCEAQYFCYCADCDLGGCSTMVVDICPSRCYILLGVAGCDMACTPSATKDV